MLKFKFGFFFPLYKQQKFFERNLNYKFTSDTNNN